VPPFDIRVRAFDFACCIVKLCLYLMKETPTPRKIAEQLLASGTSVGSNLEEAEAGHSHADFVAKISTCLKEARETRALGIRHYKVVFNQATIFSTTLGLTERSLSWPYSSTSPVVAGTSR
jgi:four helix bundle protein